MKTFAERLRYYRQHTGITMVEAARAMKVPYRTWQNWELGINEPRGIGQRLILAEIRRRIDALVKHE